MSQLCCPSLIQLCLFMPCQVPVFGFQYSSFTGYQATVSLSLCLLSVIVCSQRQRATATGCGSSSATAAVCKRCATGKTSSWLCIEPGTSQRNGVARPCQARTGHGVAWRGVAQRPTHFSATDISCGAFCSGGVWRLQLVLAAFAWKLIKECSRCASFFLLYCCSYFFFYFFFFYCFVWFVRSHPAWHSLAWHGLARGLFPTTRQQKGSGKNAFRGAAHG